MEILALRDLTFSYPQQTAPALDHVSLAVKEGEFLLLCGPSGCGKSTLLRHFKSALAPHGSRSGEVLFDGRPLHTLDQREQSRRIGFVLQSPEDQLVTDKVWHELAFGLESLGLDTPTIRRRVAEMASFFGIQNWFYQDVAALSGGQKQLLNLAAVMVMQPDVLLLDEPTGQLDPLAAADFLAMLGRINRELGTTIVMTEHRTEEALPLATRAAVLEGGRLAFLGAPRAVCEALKKEKHPMLFAMPTSVRVWAAVGDTPPCPLTVREGRDALKRRAEDHPFAPLPPEETPRRAAETVIEAGELWFRYEREGSDVLKGLSLTVQKGELLALVGGNGTGKTTALRALAGLAKPYRGKLRVTGRTGLLPQEPKALFARKTVREEMCELGADPERVDEIVALCALAPLLERHPYDLSGGEQQRAALAKVLLAAPDVLLLDEPTKGMDAAFKRSFGALLHALTQRGVTIVMVSHDMEFCARYAHRCALFFDGAVIAEGTPREFFGGNRFYTTAASRMTQGLLPDAVTPEDVIAACGAPLPREPEPPVLPPPPEAAGEGTSEAPPSRRALPRRTAAGIGCLLLLIPATLLLGTRCFGARKYYATAFLILIEAMLPFFLAFEGRRPQARELMTVAVLCALGVAGRAAFFMLPQCKPVMALTIVSGTALGGETGFLVGAVTMLASNVLFSQGPWTPWQMFAMGLAGFLAGSLFHRRAPLRRARVPLSVFGALAALALYGGVMNGASALLAQSELTAPILWSYYVSGFPMDCVHAAATAVFLWFGAEPMLEKLERVKRKYGA